MAEGVGFGEESACFKANSNPFNRVINHYPLNTPPLLDHYSKGTLIGTPTVHFV